MKLKVGIGIFCFLIWGCCLAAIAYSQTPQTVQVRVRGGGGTGVLCGGDA